MQKFAHIPGVTYATPVAPATPAAALPNYTRLPRGWTTTSNLARLLGCTPSGIRYHLSRHRVPSRHIRHRGRHTLIWLKTAVDALPSLARPILPSLPPGYINQATAAKRLGISPSTLSKRLRTRRVHTTTIILRPAGEPPHHHRILPADVLPLLA